MVIDFLAEKLSSRRIEVYVVATQRSIGHRYEIDILHGLRQLDLCLLHALGIAPASVRDTSEDHRQRGVALLARLLDDIGTHVVDDSLHVVIVAFRCLPVALTLMPDEGFDLVALLALGQLLVYAGTNVLGESLQ